MAASEVWPNAPLALVAVEARFPAATTSPLRPPVQRAIRDRLGADWVIEGAKQQTLEFAFGSGGAQAPNLKVEDLSRITSRDRTQAVTLRPESLSIEATSYNGYASFRELIAAAFEAVEQVVSPDGLTRLGMRFIDEIRVPADDGVDWAAWVDPSLLAPQASGLDTESWTGMARYDTGDQRRLVLRYGPSDGPVVDPAGPLRRLLKPKPGPVFVLDFDSFWQPDTIPAFTEADLLIACDELRAPARTLFDQLMTRRLVDEVFRKEPGA